jgi:hypothetical protein
MEYLATMDTKFQFTEKTKTLTIGIPRSGGDCVRPGTKTEVIQQKYFKKNYQSVEIK